MDISISSQKDSFYSNCHYSCHFFFFNNTLWD